MNFVSGERGAFFSPSWGEGVRCMVLVGLGEVEEGEMFANVFVCFAIDVQSCPYYGNLHHKSY